MDKLKKIAISLFFFSIVILLFFIDSTSKDRVETSRITPNQSNKNKTPKGEVQNREDETIAQEKNTERGLKFPFASIGDSQFDNYFLVTLLKTEGLRISLIDHRKIKAGKNLLSSDLDEIESFVIFSNEIAPSAFKEITLLKEKKLEVLPWGRISGQVLSDNVPVSPSEISVSVDRKTQQLAREFIRRVREAARNSYLSLPVPIASRFQRLAVPFKANLLREGKFAFDNLFFPGNYLLEASSKGHQTKFETIRLTTKRPSQSHNIKLLKSIIVSGELWGNRAPITEAKFNVYQIIDLDKKERQIIPRRVSVSLSKGQFEVDSLGPGKYRFVINAFSSETSWPIQLSIPLELTGFHFDVGRINCLKYSITGKLTYPNGKPIPDNEIRAFNYNDPSYFFKDLVLKTNNLGEFQIFVNRNQIVNCVPTLNKDNRSYKFNPLSIVTNPSRKTVNFVIEKIKGRPFRFVFKNTNKHSSFLAWSPTTQKTLKLEYNKVMTGESITYTGLLPNGYNSDVIDLYEFDRTQKMTGSKRLKVLAEDSELNTTVDGIDWNITEKVDLQVHGVDRVLSLNREIEGVKGLPAISISVKHGKSTLMAFRLPSKSESICMPRGGLMRIFISKTKLTMNGEQKILAPVKEGLFVIDLR